MKKIKIQFGNLPLYLSTLVVKLLNERYDVEITDNPDYLFCGASHLYNNASFSGIRIYCDGECLFPNMNFFDYALSEMIIGENERCIKIFSPILDIRILEDWNYSINSVKDKNGFCNFIYTHPGDCFRTEIFDVINRYKKVDSAGRWLNNMQGYMPGNNNRDFDAKIEFQKKYKFTIAVENYSYPYYCTEKIVDAFRSNTIPIYYGDPKITKIFNEKAFINLHNYGSFEDALDDIITLDTDDEKYIKMLNEPKFVDSDFLEKQVDKVREFLFHIFDQKYEEAFRRPNFIWPRKNEIMMKMANYIFENKTMTEKFNRYFSENRIKKVAVYGKGIFFEYIKEYLMSSDIEVVCFIESFPKKDMHIGFPVYSVCDEEKYNEVDVILVTIGYDFKEIELIMKRYGIKKSTISIDEILDFEYKIKNMYT